VRDADLAAFETVETEVRLYRRHVLVATDGEVTAMQTPLRYRILPGALRVIAPAAQ
jgi:diacylglycerol kinase family enzyme